MSQVGLKSLIEVLHVRVSKKKRRRRRRRKKKRKKKKKKDCAFVQSKAR